jgi:hypothetical protein
LTVQTNVLSLQDRFQPSGKYPNGYCYAASADLCPSRQALGLAYTATVGQQARVYSIGGTLSYSSTAAGASAGDIVAAVNAFDSISGSLCATVPAATTSLYKCSAVQYAIESKSSIRVEGSTCSGSVGIEPWKQNVNASVGWGKCTVQGALPTYLIIGTNWYGRYLQLGLGQTRAISDNPTAVAVECIGTTLAPTGRQIQYTKINGRNPLILVDSDSMSCQANNTDFSDLAT